jgi:ABC-type glycerol-3-phosphate transport system permease component
VSRLFGRAVALMLLLAGLAALAVACWAALPGAAAALRDPALPTLLVQAAAPAAGAATLALLPGLAAASAIRRAGRRARLAVFGIAICLLMLPAPPLTGWPRLDALAHGQAGGLPFAALRGAAAVLLITSGAVAAIPPGLRQAARLAGATGFRAWRHVVLAQVWRACCLGWLAAALAALAQTPAAGLAGHLDAGAVWLLAGALVLIACSAPALGAPRRTGARLGEAAYLQ